MNISFLQQLGIEIPLIQAPMAGGISTPELVACVSNAGGLGSLGAGYLFPKELQASIRKIKSLTSKPFNVNLFIPNDVQLSEQEFLRANEPIRKIWEKITDEPFADVTYPLMPSFEEQMEVILAEKVPIFSFTFGIASDDCIQRCKKEGIIVIGTATTPKEAIQLDQAGVDAIVCQGNEAGGHRGSFLPNDPMHGLQTLISLTLKSTKLPIIAAGGIMNGTQVAALLKMGASAAQLGTVFIPTRESGANPTYKEALLERPGKSTVVTDAFTGKMARAIDNSLRCQLETFKKLPYPYQHYLTAKLRKLAGRMHNPEYMSLWAGMGYRLCKKMSAGELIAEIKKILNEIFL